MATAGNGILDERLAWKKCVSFQVVEERRHRKAATQQVVIIIVIVNDKAMLVNAAGLRIQDQGILDVSSLVDWLSVIVYVKWVQFNAEGVHIGFGGGT